MHNIHFDGELIATINGQRIGNSKRIDLLEHIARLGSISQAAKAVPMSYKAAWDAIDALNNMAAEPLVTRHTGGQGGGKSTLTAFGRDFVAYYRQMQSQHQQIIQQLEQNAAHHHLWQHLNIQISADNQLAGIISAVRHGSVNDEIQFHLSNGQKLVAQITTESSHNMALAKNTPIFALIQASAIMLARPSQNLQISARNQLPAIIRRIDSGSINCIVHCDLGQELSLKAAITCTSAQTMALKEGEDIELLIKAPSMLIGRLG